MWTADFDSIYSYTDIPSACRVHVEDTHSWSYTCAWSNSDEDLIYEIVAASSIYLQQAAIATGQDVENAVVYPNYASPSTFSEDIKKDVDPDTAMGLARGWNCRSP
jgi:hypothetical protein